MMNMELLRVKDKITNKSLRNFSVVPRGVVLTRRCWSC